MKVIPIVECDGVRYRRVQDGEPFRVCAGCAFDKQPNLCEQQARITLFACFNGPSNSIWKREE